MKLSLCKSLSSSIFALGVVGAMSILITPLKGDGPADNKVNSVRPIPPPGIMIDPKDREKIQGELDTLKSKISELKKQSRKATIQKYLPDVEIFAKAVEIALKEDGFYEPRDVGAAQTVLQEGLLRAEALLQEKTPWTEFNGRNITVRGFRSKLDNSVQPYGIVANTTAPNADSKSDSLSRADVWCRGRSEKGLEMQFIATRMTNPDPAPVSGVIMIHPFGRYCNANKLAGEVDTLEAIEHAVQEYPIDPKRVAIRGFSMGGAAAWHLAVHYPNNWFAANPGAGFSETPDFLKVFQTEELKPYWFEQKLWQMYDCPVWARNIQMLPTVAYSGEIDKQKQAADLMAAACWNLPAGEKFELTHVIAPNVAHKFDPVARVEVEQRLAAIDSLRKRNRSLENIAFTTATLKYNSAGWIKVNALEEHWKPATVKAKLITESTIYLAAANVTDITIDIPADLVPHSLYSVYVLKGSDTDTFDQELDVLMRDANNFYRVNLPVRSDRSWGVRLRRSGQTWEAVSPIESASKELVKRHDLQGPIDDAFMAPFVFVKPTTAGRNQEVDKWVDSEMQRAVREWHRQMRGDVIVKTSEELKPEDITKYNLVLWGDPQSNATIGKIAEQLPIQWQKEQIIVGDRKFDSAKNAPVLIYPNPLNPHRYIVLNSGFTYREYDYLNNARQVPKLPDWAIVDLSVAPDSRWPGKIADADFFDEKWQLKPSQNQK